MIVEQATLRSDSRYHDGQAVLVAKSPGIDENLAARLGQWTPGCWDMPERQPDCVHFYRPIKNKLVVSRSIHSHLGRGRNGHQTVLTSATVVETNQLEGYHHNAVLFANTMLSMGNLHLLADEILKLPSLEVPDGTFFTAEDCFAEMDPRRVDSISRAIEIHKQVAIFGVPNPLGFLGGFLGMLPNEQRLRTSFTTGSGLSKQRPFNLHFFATENADLKKELVQAQIRTISIEPSIEPVTII